MGKLDVHITHGGGDSQKVLLYVALAVVAVIVLGGSVAAISSAIFTLLITLVAVVSAGLVLGAAGWYLTRGKRAAANEAFEQYRLDREEAYHQRQLELMKTKAQIKAAESASMAIMISEAIKAGHQTEWPNVRYQPPTVRAEVIKPEDDK